MATSPIFASTPVLGFASVTAANTNRDGTGTIVDIVTSGSSGTRIDEIVLQATGNPADSTVTIYIHDGSSYRLFDEFDIGDPAAASTTLAGYRASRSYTNLVLPTGYKLAAAITVALTSGAINVFAHGANF